MNKVKLKEVVDIFNGSTPSTLNDDYFNGNIPWLTPKDLSDQKKKYIFKGERSISKLGLKSIGNRLLPVGTILFSSRAPIGLMSISKSEVSTNQGFKNMVCKADKISNEYLYYLLKIKTSFIQELGTGTTFKEVSKKTLDDFEIFIEEDLSIQKKIAAVLSALDDKIELNNKINIELEQMAKTLYDYWFVQFDFPFDFAPFDFAQVPITFDSAQGKRNENGTVAERSRGYKSSGGEMVYDVVLKREIPKGWEVKKLEEVESNIITGKTPSTLVESNFGGDIPFVTIDDIRKQLYIFKSDRTLTELGASTQSSKFLNDGDICVSCIGTVGVIGIVGKRCQTNQQINSISKIKDYNRYFLLNALRMYFEFNTGAKQGAVLSNMNKGEFSEILIVDPSLELKKKYLEKVKPLYQKIKINLQQNQELASLRDWLLPMLMNGQVRVGESDGEVLGLVAEEKVNYQKKKNFKSLI